MHDDEIKTGFYAKTEICLESADIDNFLERMKLNVLKSLESFEINLVNVKSFGRFRQIFMVFI